MKEENLERELFESALDNKRADYLAGIIVFGLCVFFITVLFVMFTYDASTNDVLVYSIVFGPIIVFTAVGVVWHHLSKYLGRKIMTMRSKYVLRAIDRKSEETIYDITNIPNKKSEKCNELLDRIQWIKKRREMISSFNSNQIEIEKQKLHEEEEEHKEELDTLDINFQNQVEDMEKTLQALKELKIKYFSA